jgi:TolB-like protein/class 3 adenylate cyclase/tetratricopeptide (TPR) repeat protein
LEAPSVERKLAAIFAADVAGYSALMGRDEVGTLRTLTAYRVIIDRLIASHRGRIFNTAGDSLVADFSSAVDAVQCAVTVQDAIAKENSDRPVGEQMRFRIGIHVGDIMVQEDNLFGDAVNIAARLEALAEPGGICASGVVRDHIGTKLPLSFADLGEQHVKNIAQPIKAYRIGSETSPIASPVAGSALPLPDKPSIAVLPFQNMSGDAEQEYFADGMVEEIITALSRIRWLFVIARNSSFVYKGKAIDVKQVGRELGVRYVLEGSVRKAGGRVRITAQLIDAQSGTHLWADRFDGSFEDVFDLQDKVAFSAAGIIESTLQAAEIRRAADRPTTDLTAYDLYLRARPHCRSWDRERIRSALGLLERALERDPKFGPALALAAVCHHHFHTIGGVDDPAMHRRAALGYAQRALQAAPSDPGTIAEVAYIHMYFGEDIEPAIKLIDRALALNPSFYGGWGISGWLRLWAGQLDVAVEHLQTAIRLSPLHPNPTQVYGIAVAHFIEGRFSDAIAMFITALHELPGHAGIYRYLASCYAHAGRLDDARKIIKRLRTITPSVLPNVVQWRRPEHREFFLSGLRRAMSEAG